MEERLSIKLVEDDSKSDLNCKIILLGNKGVGKTKLISYLNSISEINISSMLNPSLSMSSMINKTCDIDYSKITYKVNDDKIISLSIWDSTGHEKFDSLTKNFYQNAQLVILMYDITDMNSFNSIPFWYEKIKEKSEKYTRYALVGNKCEVNKRKVSYEEGKKYSDKENMDIFCEISANLGNGIPQLFDMIANLLYKEILEYQVYMTTSGINMSSFVGESESVIPTAVNEEYRKEIKKVNKKNCSC